MQAARMRESILLGIVSCVACQTGAAVDRVQLPDTPISAEVPGGWSCKATSTMFLDNEMFPVVDCLPLEGGSPIMLRKMGRSEAAASLDEFFASLQARLKAVSPEQMRVAPKKIQLGSRPAVQVAVASQGIADAVDGSASQITLVMHDITFVEAGTFYRCEMSASPSYDTETLRATFMKFCSSVESSMANRPNERS